MSESRRSGRAEWAKIRIEQIREHARWCSQSAVYDALHLFAWGEDRAHVVVSRWELSEITGLSESAVAAAIKRLIACGALVVGRSRGHYILCTHSAATGADTDLCGADATRNGADTTRTAETGTGRMRPATGADTDLCGADATAPPIQGLQRDRRDKTQSARARACGLDSVERKTESPGPPARPATPPAAARPGDNGSGRQLRDPATPSNATPRVVAGVDAETASAVDRLLDWPGWLAGLNRDPPRKKARTLALVRAYVAAGHDPATVELWIRAARHQNAGLLSPHAWAHAHLAGYGQDGWQPKTLSGGEQKLHAAILASDWDRAEKQLNRKHFRLAEAAAAAEADHASRDLASLATDPEVLARVAGVVRAKTAESAPARAHDRDVALTEADRRLAVIAASANAADATAQRSSVLAEAPSAAAAAARPSPSADVATPDSVEPANGRQNASGAKAREPTSPSPDVRQPAEEAA